MKKDYVLVMKVERLTTKQANKLSFKSRDISKSIAPGSRTVFMLEKKGE